MQQHGASFRTSNIRQFASGYFPMRSGVNPKTSAIQTTQKRDDRHVTAQY